MVRIVTLVTALLLPVLVHGQPQELVTYEFSGEMTLAPVDNSNNNNVNELSVATMEEWNELTSDFYQEFFRQRAFGLEPLAVATLQANFIAVDSAVADDPDGRTEAKVSFFAQFSYVTTTTTLLNRDPAELLLDVYQTDEDFTEFVWVYRNSNVAEFQTINSIGIQAQLPSALNIIKVATDTPTGAPSASPTRRPTPSPTPGPTDLPTAGPSSFPTAFPTSSPTKEPTTTEPTDAPAEFPTTAAPVTVAEPTTMAPAATTTTDPPTTAAPVATNAPASSTVAPVAPVLANESEDGNDDTTGDDDDDTKTNANQSLKNGEVTGVIGGIVIVVAFVGIVIMGGCIVYYHYKTKRLQQEKEKLSQTPSSSGGDGGFAAMKDDTNGKDAIHTGDMSYEAAYSNDTNFEIAVPEEKDDDVSTLAGPYLGPKDCDDTTIDEEKTYADRTVTDISQTDEYQDLLKGIGHSIGIDEQAPRPPNTKEPMKSILNL